MTYELRLQIKIFRLMLKQNRKEARKIGALSRQMRERATALRLATHAETAEQIKCLLAAQPIATIFYFSEPSSLLSPVWTIEQSGTSETVKKYENAAAAGRS